MTTGITTEIAEYSPTTAGLNELKARLKGVTYEVTNATGMALAKFNRRELVTLRTDLERKRIEIKAPALERCRLIDAEAKRITAELYALEAPIDTQIKAEEARKEEEKAEKARIAAAAQKILDDKILEIGKLPLRCMGKTAVEIQTFLDFIISKEMGGEFIGECRERAEAARTEAVKEINIILGAMRKAEEEAAVIKSEQEAEAERQEEARLLEVARLAEEQVERDRLAAIEKVEVEKRQAILDEQKRVNDEALAKLDAERAAFAAEQKIEADKRAEILRIAREKEELAEAEMKRQLDEAAAKQRAIDQQAAVDAEAARKKAEVERKAAEKARKLAESKFKDVATALQAIQDICADDRVSDLDARGKISVICEANIA
jgi:hypothetical protein